jgi:hypothetical protein
MTLSDRRTTGPVASTSVIRRLAVAILGLAVFAGACSTSVYTSDQAVRDLERQAHLTHAQAGCIVTAIRRHFEVVIKASQKANQGSPLPADRLRLEVDSALAAIRDPSSSEQAVARAAIARCAPNALR